MSMPEQKPATSKQDYETPPEFLRAVAARFGPIDVDLACTRANKKATIGLAIEDGDSLAMPWADRFPDANMWLNPPFRRVEPWARKCREEAARLRRGKIIMLTPAAVSTNWFADHVHGNALVLPVLPRIVFVGEANPFPKDLMLMVFTRETSAAWKPSLWSALVRAVTMRKVMRAGFEPWRWSKTEDDDVIDEASVTVVDEETVQPNRRKRRAKSPPKAATTNPLVPTEPVDLADT